MQPRIDWPMRLLLAERLSRQPGWELRGEVILGQLRSELNDPGGAVKVLGHALARPEATGLELQLQSRYRRILVRSLLRIDNPADARKELAPLLASGPDAEDHWLQSRVALASGALTEATAALDAAGSYRKLHPLESEPCGYVGEARCAKCHDGILEALHASRHSSTLLRGQELAQAALIPIVR